MKFSVLNLETKRLAEYRDFYTDEIKFMDCIFFDEKQAYRFAIQNGIDLKDFVVFIDAKYLHPSLIEEEKILCAADVKIESGEKISFLDEDYSLKIFESNYNGIAEMPGNNLVLNCTDKNDLGLKQRILDEWIGKKRNIYE